MAGEEPEVAFKVTDRRRRGEDESARPAEPRREPEPPPASAPHAADAGPSLVGLFTMLADSALMALGEPDPGTGQFAQRDLPTAAELIDVLGLLRERTDGRRTAEESQVLDELLYDLQMRYVSLTKRPE
jgi:hypothetical protein